MESEGKCPIRVDWVSDSDCRGSAGMLATSSCCCKSVGGIIVLNPSKMREMWSGSGKDTWVKASRGLPHGEYNGASLIFAES